MGIGVDSKFGFPYADVLQRCWRKVLDDLLVLYQFRQSFEVHSYDHWQATKTQAYYLIQSELPVVVVVERGVERG